MNIADAYKFTELKVLTWNIEGLKTNQYYLIDFLFNHKPDLAFLSEPQVYSCDAAIILDDLKDIYLYELNSGESTNLIIPYVKSRDNGGTLAMWNKWLDPHINIM